MLQIPPSPLFFSFKASICAWDPECICPGQRWAGFYHSTMQGWNLPEKNPSFPIPSSSTKKNLPTYNPLQTSNLLSSIPFLNHVDLFLRNHRDLSFQKDPSIPAACQAEKRHERGSWGQGLPLDPGAGGSPWILGLGAPHQGKAVAGARPRFPLAGKTMTSHLGFFLTNRLRGEREGACQNSNPRQPHCASC